MQRPCKIRAGLANLGIPWNKIIIYPLEIKLLNNDGFIEKKWSQANINDDPKIFEYKIEFKSKVSDKGNPELFHTYTDILGDNNCIQFCKINNFLCKIKILTLPILAKCSWVNDDFPGV